MMMMMQIAEAGIKYVNSEFCFNKIQNLIENQGWILRNRTLPYDGTLLVPSTWSFFLPFTKCPTSWGESNYKVKPLLRKIRIDRV